MRIVGEGEVAQPHVAGALLALLDGCTLHTISLPALITSGASSILISICLTPLTLLATRKATTSIQHQP